MDYIKRIEIDHFRSINELVIKDLTHINVFSGLNDVGKSNVIKALNLFFNNEVDWNTPFDFQRDTNSWHAHYSSAGHNKRYISIKLTFRRPTRYKDRLDDEFWVERFWDRDNQDQPKTTWGSADTTRSWDDRPRALTEFMNRSHFFYVPAIRSHDYIGHLLLQFSKAITDRPSKELQSASESLSKEVFRQSSALRQSLKRITRMEFTLELPKSLLALLETAGLFTEGNTPLRLRGDGIQSLTVAGLLDYLTSLKKKDFYYWGFEEPENSLEYIWSTELAKEIEENYSQRSQIFLSTHSPAFLAMESTKTSTYRVLKRFEREYQGYTDEVSYIESVFLGQKDRQNELIADELGFFELVRKIDREYREYENNKRDVEDKLAKLQQATKPLLIVEGKHDLDTLKHAWDRLYQGSIPFEIVAADGESKLRDLVLQWHRISNGRRIAALLDHDLAGIGCFGKLSRNFCAQESSGEDLSCVSGDFKIMTLPPPSSPDRKDQALNKNLSMEFYFSDDFLNDIDKQSGHQLFRKDKLINDGKHVVLDEESVNDLFDSGRKTMIHRALNNDESAKKKLVEALTDLDDVEFLPFHKLFKLLVQHLKPDYELELKPHLSELLAINQN